MTERSVVVRLKADTTAFTAKMVAAGRSAETAFLASSSAAEKNRKALTTVGNAAGIMGAAAAAGVGIAIKSAADFDKAMSGVNAATHASAGEMDRMRGLALKMGADTAFSATEAADGIEQLSKAGVSTGDIMAGGLKGALALAAAGEIEVGDAAESAATAMTMFGLKGADVPHVADLLAAAAGKAQGEVGDFSAALNQSGLVANQTGLSIEETTGALAAFASKGLIGSDAGTSLKTMLQSLTPASEKAEQAMEDNGISAYNAQGSFIGLEKWAGKLRDGLSGMSDEQRNATLKTVFGSDAVRAASVIYEEGAVGVGKWVDKVNDAGYAADTAARKQDNLAGDIEKLQGALSTLLIETGESGQGPLRSLTQGATDAVDALNGLPGPVKTATLAFGGLVAVTGGAAFLGSRFITAIADAKVAMTTLGVTANTTKIAMANIGKGLTLAGVLYGIHKIDDAFDDLFHTRLDQSGLQQDLVNLGKTGQVSGNMLETFGGNLAGFAVDVDKLDDGLVSAKYGVQGFTNAMIGWAPGTTAFEAAGDRVKGLDQALASLVRSGNAETARSVFNELAAAARKQGVSVETLRQYLPGYAAAMGRAGGASKDAVGPTEQHADAVDDDTAALKDETSALQQNINAHNRRANRLLANIDTEVAWEQAVDDASKEAGKGTKTLNTNTQAGRDNITALSGMAAAWKDLPDKTKRAEGGIKAAREEFIRIARQMGADKDQAHALARELLNIPNPKRKVEVDTADARAEVSNFVADLAGKLRGIKDEDVRIQLATSAQSILQTAKGLNIFGKEYGGPIPGYLGTPGRDSVPVLTMPDEHVVTTKEVRAAGKGNAARGHRIWEGIRKAALMGALPDPNDLPAYATGGAIRPQVAGSGEAAAMAMVSRLAAGIAGEIGGALSDRLNKALQFGGAGQPLGPGGTLSGGQLVRGQQFAQSQVGKPYIWGGVGPGGYDCSGFQSAIYNSAVGRNPYSRIGSTGTMPWPGMAMGTGGYTIGWFTGSPGHMSGNIGGLNVESSGDVGAHVGSGARSPLDAMFNAVAHYDSGGPLHPGWTLAHNGTGATEYVVRGYQDGGEVTKAERQERRQQRREDAREEEKAVREHERARLRALREFDIGGRGLSARDVRAELRDLTQGLREALGRDAPILKTLDRVDNRMVATARQRDKLIKASDGLSEHLASLRDQRNQLARDVAGNFLNDPFGGSLQDFSLQVRADRNDAARMRHALHTAEGKGLSGGLYRQLAQSGNFLLAQQFAHQSRRQIEMYERQFAQRSRTAGGLGRMVGAEVYGDRIHENSRELRHTNRALNHNTRELRRMGRHLVRRVPASAGGARKRARSG